MSLGLGFEVSEAQARPSGLLFLLPANSEVEVPVPLQHHVGLSAAMFVAIILVGYLIL